MKYGSQWRFWGWLASDVFPLEILAQSRSAYISMNTFVRPNQQVIPMSHADRVHLGAVP